MSCLDLTHCFAVLLLVSVASCFGDLSDMLAQGLKADSGIFPSSLDRHLKRVLMSSTSRVMRAAILHQSNSKRSYNSSNNKRVSHEAVDAINGPQLALKHLPARPHTVSGNRAYIRPGSSRRYQAATTTETVTELTAKQPAEHALGNRVRPHTSHAVSRAGIHSSKIIAIDHRTPDSIYLTDVTRGRNRNTATTTAAAAAIATVYKENVKSPRHVQTSTQNHNGNAILLYQNDSMSSKPQPIASRKAAREQLAALQQRQMIALTAIASANCTTAWRKAWLACELKVCNAYYCCYTVCRCVSTCTVHEAAYHLYT
jgi:hypothetical protein